MGEIIPQRDDENSLAKDYVAEGGVDTTALAVATTRAAEEVKARMVIAKRFPRDEATSFARIMKACQRTSLAERAEYQYPRGGQTVRGPSIRLAEVLARAWGNVDAGFAELEQRDGESVVEAFAWDLETNTRIVRTFTVPHKRDTKKGSYKLTDSRDIYELVANQAQRRVRACILGIIPGDVVDAAVDRCQKTLAGSSKEPLSDRVRVMVAAFSEFGVSGEMISARLGHKLEVVTEGQLAELRRVYTSIRDGVSDAAQWFSPPEDPGAEALRNRLTNGTKKTLPPAKTAAPKRSQKTAAPAAQETADAQDEVPENVDPITGEVLDEQPPEPAKEQTNLGDLMQKANGTAAGMTSGEKDRANAIDEYLALCDSLDVRPKSVSQMSLQAIRGHIEALKAQN